MEQRNNLMREAESAPKRHEDLPDHDCLVPPAEFVRMRYFFGQRLGVIDLADEQSYVVGKQRFHNLRAHGAGVLCGLRAERYVFPQGSSPATPTTLLRVRRGAALDWCGREVIVGWDQCIDVAAWFAKHKEAQMEAANATRLRLWVALCYRECPSDPAPAPRDPCGCDAEGCEFARTREGFELKLLTDAELKTHLPSHHCLIAAPIAEEILDDLPEKAYARAVALLSGTDCHEAHDCCLLLADFWAKLDSSHKKIVDIEAPDNTIPERHSLLPTAILQRGILRMLAAAADAELSGQGPRYSRLTFAHGTGAASGTLSTTLSGPVNLR